MTKISRFSQLITRARACTPAIRKTSFYLIGFATWIPAFVFFNTHVAELAWVKGSSMYPYLNPDYNRTLRQDVCINWKWSPLDGLQRGMIITFWSPYHPNTIAVKRVVALEHDEIHTRAPYPFHTVQVPAGHVWVEGDGGVRSLDSNTYGPISKSLIIGKIVFAVWPWSNFGRIRWEDYRDTRVIKR